MKLIPLIILTLAFNNVLSQIDFETDANKDYLYPDIIAEIGNLSKDYDFQFRFWIHGGIAIPAQKDLFVMTFKNGIWNCQNYQFVYRKRRKYRIVENDLSIENCDSIWNYFNDNKILNLPDMESLKKDFYFLDSNGDTLKTMVMDGLNYSFEFLKYDKYKLIEYHSPITYSKKYTHIPELKYISNIIRLIYRKIGKDI
ncbi:MAG: hypothetical protein RBR97_17930 [Bacteroidales bacterium]|jgi:hypothetical protein|nr:hypothetical protein [Bacteroidales bacterium]